MVSAKKQVNLIFLLGFILGIFSMLIWNNYAWSQAELKNHQPISEEKDCALNLLQTVKKDSVIKLSTTSSPATTTTTQTVTCPSQETCSEDALMHSVDITHKERRMTLLKACRRLNANCSKLTTKPHLRSLYSKKYKFSTCDIYKSASSSWLRTVLVIEGYYPVEEYNHMKGENVIHIGLTKLRLKHSGDNETMQRNWNQSLNIITVRGPFHRLVSAYNDKMQPQSAGFTSYYGPLSRKINQGFRHLRHNKEDRNRTDDGTATFEDFVNFLVHSEQPERQDGDWLSYELSCFPCIHKYDVITKFKTLNEDMLYLKNYLNITEEERKAFFPHISLTTSDKIVEEYFKQIPPDLAEYLYEKCRSDFELFGYEKPSWFL